MVDDFNKTLLKTKHHKLIFGVDRTDFGASKVQIGFLFYRGINAWEIGAFLWVFNVYLRLDRTYA